MQNRTPELCRASRRDSEVVPNPSRATARREVREIPAEGNETLAFEGYTSRVIALLVVFNSVVQTYLQSLKRDLATNGFEAIILNASISWVGAPVILLALYLLGTLDLPDEPLFYILWVGVATITVVKFTFFVIGLQRSVFLAANTFAGLQFAMIALYAVIFLNETITGIQAVALAIAFLGALLFFRWRQPEHNMGILLILFSILLAPLGSIFYKAASLHTNSYHQFLTGRLTMDIICYSSFLLLMFIFWYRRNPLPRIRAFLSTKQGFIYTAGWATTNLIDSWLIFSLPISLYAMLDTVSIPASYLIGRAKYKERISVRFGIGAVLIIVAIILFAFNAAT